MSSPVTCPACKYTRKPTDHAPDWACPQCQKLYVKTSTVRTQLKPGFCRKQPSIKSIWKCTDCNSEFCGDCVTPHLKSGSTPIAACPECKGLCFDIWNAEKIANDKREKNKIWEKGEFVYFLAALAVIALWFFFDYYSSYKRGEADAKSELPAATWHRLTLLDPEDDPPVKEMPVVQHGQGSRLSVKGYVAGHNTVVKEWLKHNQFQPAPPITKASDVDRYRKRRF